MREILFRGRRKKGDKRWVEGSLTCGYAGYVGIMVWCCAGTSFEVAPETVGQFTGLTDKNGKKIFEGDILCVEQRGETGSRICPVYFGEYIDADSVFDDYRCIGFYVKTPDGCGNIGFLLDDEFEYEVIGNIYDNPELLKGV